jgi:signal peptidase I
MVHDTIPVIKTKSYLNWPQLPYFRFPGLEKIKKNDIVVFNWPGDTVVKFFDRSGQRVDKPIDKKSNYVKRCVGTPGDSLSIKDGLIYINGKKLILPERAKPQYSYIVTYDKKTPIDIDGMMHDLKITQADMPKAMNQNNDSLYFPAVTAESAAKLKQIPGFTSVTRYIDTKPDLSVFPHTKPWNIDNYGPIYIPEEGKTIQLDLVSLPLYKRIITEYEGNKLEVKGNDIYINDKKTNSYTFKQNYYWMMGDNRHRSEDSRYWGYVPENHIVGKPIFIWMSWDSEGKGIMNKIRWERLFTTVSGEGQPQSYFKFFLGLLALYFVGEYFWKKRKADKKN